MLLFVRPTNGVYLPPKVIRLQGKSTVEEIGVVQQDMPNFFVEALTVADGKVHSEVREVVVPPEKRVVDVAVEPSQKKYKPGQKATVKVKLTDFDGKPFVGSTVLTVYDKSVEYISGGSNVPEIKEFFWKWRRNHYPQTESSLDRWFGNLVKPSEIGMPTWASSAADRRCRRLAVEAKRAMPEACAWASMAMSGMGGRTSCRPGRRPMAAEAGRWPSRRKPVRG